MPDITITADTLARILRSRDARAALLYLHIAAGGDATPKGAAAALGWSEAEAGAARAVLETSGVLSPLRAVQPSDEPPRYSADDITRAIEGEPAFAELIRYTQQRLGRVLPSGDLGRLLGIFETLEMPAGVIILLVSRVCDRERRKNGEGVRVSMYTVEREAYRWKNAGIKTENDAEKYIRHLETLEGEVARLQRIVQIRGREPTRTEQEYLERWAALGLSDELIYAAYDRTCVNTGKLNWGYMQKILLDWAENGVPAERRDAPPAASAASGDAPRRTNAAERIKRAKGT